MASGHSWQNVNPGCCCPVCGQQVVILNGDFQFSWDLHMQSHKPLDTIAQEINKQLREAKVDFKKGQKNKSNYTCPDCKESIECLNNDVKLSLQLHAQKHKSDSAVVFSEDQASTCSNKSKSSDSKKKSTKNNPNSQVADTNILESIFNSMPPGLKSHRGFIMEDDNCKLSCKICNLKIESIFSVTEHLKTKLHEDKVVLFLIEKLPASLHEMMQFVSFYGSNLCCNLCRCKIDLCSENAHETIVSIMAHNAGESHLSKKTNSQPTSQTDEALMILRSLAQINPLVNENKHLIDYKMTPQFKCKICDKNITYDRNEKIVLKNFISHLSAAGHLKCLKASSVLKSFNASYAPGKGGHNFIASKGGIVCSVCNCSVDPTVEQLILHTKQPILTTTGSRTAEMNPTTLVPNMFDNLTNNLSNVRIAANVGLPLVQKAPVASNYPATEENETSIIVNLKDLLMTLPGDLKNVDYVVKNAEGQVVCLICDCVIPATTYNLRTHITGNNHKKKVESTKPKTNENKNNTPLPAQISNTKNAQKDTTFDKVYNLILKSDVVITNSNEMFANYGDGNNYICKLCDVLIQASEKPDIFKHNLHSHLQSPLHTNKLDRQISVLQQLLGGTRTSSVAELFKMLPPYFSRDMGFIQVHKDQPNFLFCPLCRFKFPASVVSLHSHLEGLCHTTSMERCQMKNAGKNKSTNISEDVLFQNMKKDDKIIKGASKYLINKDDNLYCTLCNAIIIRSYDENLYKINILNHVTGQKHKKNISKILYDMLDKVVFSEPAFRAEKAFLEIRKEQFYCKLCDCSMSVSPEEEILKRCIGQHLQGGKHCDNKAKASGTTGGNGSSKLNQEKTSMPKKLSVNHQGTDIKIRELFSKLPVNFQDDISNIKNSPNVEGYLFCILCTSVINPHYLRDHLEEADHIQRKSGGGNPFNQANSYNMRERGETLSAAQSVGGIPFFQTMPPNLAQNQNAMGAMISLLGNIDKKLPWPVKQ